MKKGVFHTFSITYILITLLLPICYTPNSYIILNSLVCVCYTFWYFIYKVIPNFIIK